MVHWKDSVFFGRRKDGRVRIIAFSVPPELFPKAEGVYLSDVIFDRSIDSDSWASIVASVSAGGELHNRFYDARTFHDSVGASKPAPITDLAEAVKVLEKKQWLGVPKWQGSLYRDEELLAIANWLQIAEETK